MTGTHSLRFTRRFPRSIDGRLRVVIMCLPLALCAAGDALGQTEPGTGAGFEVHGQLYSGSAPAGFEAGDGWAQGSAQLGVLDEDGLAVPPFNAQRCLDDNWGSAGDGVDQTKFAGSSNKNDDLIGPGQDSWQWGAGGGGPRKNDITNTYFHTRVDPGNGHRWVFIAAETRSTSGDSHVDFEFNQAGVLQVGETSGLLVGQGPDGGRTPNDFIVSIDFLSGGAMPATTVRSWNGSAFVEMLVPDGAVFSAANSADIAHGSAGSWKHFDGSGAVVEVLSALQLVEAGIDLTALGIDINVCSTEATFTVKSRASSSFTGELKDFVLEPFLLSAVPEAVATNSGPVCPGESVQLFAGPDGEGLSYAWTGPGYSSDEQNPVVSPAVAGTYCVTVSNVDGCSSTACTDVVVPPPIQATAANDGPVCEDAAVQLLAGPDGLSYSWTGPGGFTSQEQDPVVSPALAGTYCVTVSDALGCSDTACTEVAVVILPVATASNAGPVCEGGDVQLSAGPDGLSYAWTGPGGFASNEQNPVVLAALAGVYCVTVSDEIGCSDIACTEVILNLNPTCFISGPEFICANSSCNVFAGPGGAAASGGGWRLSFGSSPPVLYSWTIMGDAEIVSPPDQESVFVDPVFVASSGDDAGGLSLSGGGEVGSFTLFLTTTSADGCTSNCSLTVPIVDCPEGQGPTCEGCSPGYWMQPQHLFNWPEPWTPAALFAESGVDDLLFEDAFPGMSLLQVLQQGGGGLNALGRHAVAAVLNGGSPDVNFSFPPNTVIQMFNEVFPGTDQDYADLKNFLEGLNLQGCPLGGPNTPDEVDEGLDESDTVPSGAGGGLDGGGPPP